MDLACFGDSTPETLVWSFPVAAATAVFSKLISKFVI